MNTQLMFSSNDQTWSTPNELFNRLNREFNFTLDPCAFIQTAKCFNFYDPTIDGLSQDWGNNTVFVNPPYGRELPLWVKKSYEESLKGATVVMLIPSRSDSRAFHDYCMKASEIRFIKGRIKFGNATTPAPFPSMIVIFDNRMRNNQPTVFKPYIQKLNPLITHEELQPLLSCE